MVGIKVSVDELIEKLQAMSEDGYSLVKLSMEDEDTCDINVIGVGLDDSDSTDYGIVENTSEELNSYY